MPRVALTGGAYQARSVIASAQRSLNLYAEPMPQVQGEPAQFAYYPTSGTTLLGALPKGPVRGIRQATTGGVYAVGGDTVFLVNPTDWSSTALGTMTGGRPYPVSMQDNGLSMVVVDGTATGWTIDLNTHAFAAITDTAFYGADRVDYLDTYLLFNKPATPQFYASDSLATTFDPLWFANKESYSDLLVSLAVAKREIWLLGERTTEVWANVGAADFPFQEVGGVFVDHGCRARYSVATYDNAVYWLSYDRAGQGIVLTGAGYQTKRISTYAIEAELTTYPRIDDAIGFVYSLGGHVFYVLAFPTADKTWVYDITTEQWHEWLWIDANGEEHRHRANCAYAVNGTVVVGDWESGNLYAVDPHVYTDNGSPIKRQRSYPHVLNEMDRVFYRQFVADLESGNPGATPGRQNIGTVLRYSPQLVISPWNGTLVTQNGLCGMPASFRYLLYSVVVCLPSDSGGGANSIVELANSITLGLLSVTRTSIRVRLIPAVNASPIIDATLAGSIGSVRSHVLISIDSVAQILQVYVNDAPVAIPSGLWTGSGMLNISSFYSHWNVLSAGSWSAAPGGGPGVADVWLASPASFFDLSVTANRRRFINADLSLVDLGTDGSEPLGHAPPIFLTVRPGDTNANHFANNNGAGGGPWTINAGTISFEPGGLCTIPSSPDQAPLQTANTQIFLMWSDDRGHSYGNPVGQSIGQTGEYLTSVQWQRLGMGRDRVFALEWSVPTATALQGAWIEVASAKS